MVVIDTDAGENDVFFCDKCAYAANSDHAVSVLPDSVVDGNFSKAEIVDTPNTKTIDELAEFLHIPTSVILKTLVYIADKNLFWFLSKGIRPLKKPNLKTHLE
jgi:YbaK / prolyl-tRNA synthetases associated domain.